MIIALLKTLKDNVTALIAGAGALLLGWLTFSRKRAIRRAEEAEREAEEQAANAQAMAEVNEIRDQVQKTAKEKLDKELEQIDEAVESKRRDHFDSDW